MFEGMIVRRGGRFSAISLGMLLPVSAALLSTAAGAQNSNGNPAAQQSQQAKSLQFDAAAIKASDPKLPLNSFSSGGIPGGQFRMENTPLKQWVEMGLSVPDYALKAPSWLDTSRFDLVARMPADKPVKDPRPEMMKAILIERFGLKWHEEIQTVSGYELVADKKVLAPPATSGGGWGSGPTSLGATNIPMTKLAEMLGDVLRRPVVDSTHLSGGFNIKLVYRAIDDAAVSQAKGFGMTDADIDKLPSIFDAVREQLGLRLQSAKVPSKVIVVDNINREPTAN